MSETSQSPAAESARAEVPVAFEDPAYLAAVVDLLGAIAYGEMSAFERLAEDAKMAPDLADKAELARMAATEFGHFGRLRDRMVELGADPFEAMTPFRQPFDAFHARTAPADWLEGLVKAYVGDGLAADFYREVAAFLDTGTRDLIVESLADAGQSEFVVDRVRAAIARERASVAAEGLNRIQSRQVHTHDGSGNEGAQHDVDFPGRGGQRTCARLCQ